VFNALLTCCTKQNLGVMNDEGVLKNIFLLGNVPNQKLPIAAVSEPEKINEYFGAVLTCACILFAIKNKLILEGYIVPLIMACFCCSLNETPPKLTARPGPTGVTIAAQFMVILKHARWIASLLGLQEQLPLPSTIFQPFIYIPLHGTAFKISIKERFYNDDKEVLEYYKDLSLNKGFIKFVNLITTTDCFTSVVDQYIKTKSMLLDRKIAAAQKSVKTKKKKN